MHSEYYLENRANTGDTEHQKFYRIVVDGCDTHFTWGAIGANKPGTEDKTHESESEAFAYAQAKLKSKQAGKKGYLLITEKQGGDVPSMSTGRTAPVRRTDTVQHEQRPPETGRKFGFEVETHSNLDPKKIADQLSARKLKINYRAGSYFHSDGTSWDVKRDGSCGFEFASPILCENSGIFDVKLALEKIRGVCETAVNADCGIHVTIDVSDHGEADLRRLLVGYLKAQEHFYKRCNKTRQVNRYCQRNDVRALQIPSMSMAVCSNVVNMLARAMSPGGRYHGLNLDNMRASKPRVEFRMLESTLDARKVGTWIRTCIGFVNGLLKSGATFTTNESFSEETFDAIVAGTWSVRKGALVSA